jgi:hypothetical protein
VKKGQGIGPLGRAGAKEGEEVVKRVRLLILLGAVALALPFGILRAGAATTTTSTPTADVEIEPNAAYDDIGSILHVELKARCTGGLGTAHVEVVQPSPQAGVVPGAGEGFNFDVICDGRTHEVAVTIGGASFDAGKAKATATLTVASPLDPDDILAEDTAVRWIDIRVV